MRVAAGDRNREGSAHGYSLAAISRPARVRLIAANDNPPRHASWRRVVAGLMAILFALTLVLIGAVCTAYAAETSEIPGQAARADLNRPAVPAVFHHAIAFLDENLNRKE